MKTQEQDPFTRFEVEVFDVPKEGEQLTQYQQDQLEKKPTKKKNYAWAFFLCSFFLGLGFTATTELPFGIMAGLGIGFLFFVEPIYKKVIGLFE